MPRPLSVPRHKMQHYYLLGCCVLNNNIREEKLEYVSNNIRHLHFEGSENYTDKHIYLLNNFYINKMQSLPLLFSFLTNFRAYISGSDCIHHYPPTLDNFRHYLLAVQMMAVPKQGAVG